MAEADAGDPLSVATPYRFCDLFDRNREPPDQHSNLVQTLEIVVPNGLRKPNEAFLIAHRGNVAWNERRHRSHQIGLDVWHRITSWEPGVFQHHR